MYRICTATCLAVVCFAASHLSAAELDKQKVEELIKGAENYLLQHYNEDGSITKQPMFRLGVTAVCIEALLFPPASIPVDGEKADQTLDFLLSYQQDDGGIYDPQEGVANYVTSLTLMAMDQADLEEEGVVAKAHDFLIGIQNMDEDSNNFGGIGYGSRGEGNEDLNNTTYAIQALRRTGLPADHPAMKRAMTFVERCQNLSTFNDQPWAQNGSSDGGGIYSPDVSKAGGTWADEAALKAGAEQAERGVLYSYGSMTYALITSYIYLDLSPGDPRLDAALDWVKSNYAMTHNPGMPEKQAKQGWYYYLTLISKTFDLLDMNQLELGESEIVDWRADMIEILAEHAQQEGDAYYWTNEADRWNEGDPVMVTAYVLKNLKRIHNTF